MAQAVSLEAIKLLSISGETRVFEVQVKTGLETFVEEFTVTEEGDGLFSARGTKRFCEKFKFNHDVQAKVIRLLLEVATGKRLNLPIALGKLAMLKDVEAQLAQRPHFLPETVGI